MNKKLTELPAIVLSMGDPLGIGPEIIAKAIPRLKKICRPLVIGEEATMNRALRTIGSKQKTNVPGGLLLYEPRLDEWEKENAVWIGSVK